MVVFDEEKQKKRIAEIRMREEEALVQQIAQRTGVTYIDLTGVGIDTDALKVVPESESRKKEIAAFKIVGKDLHIAARAPKRKEVAELIQKLEGAGYHTALYMASQKSLEKAWNRYADISMAEAGRGSFLDISDESLQKISDQVQTNKDIERLFKTSEKEKSAHRISRLIEIIFGSGIATGASDIHIEPQDADVRLRFRQDGVLHDILNFDHNTYELLNSRIKLLSELKLTQSEDAQDGRFTIDYKDKEIEIRTSVIPGNYGESIVMRILNPDGINVGLEQLGIEPKLLEILKNEISKPNGLILTTGPTGSGKTTTLYSFLKQVYTPEIKIITIENPVEYHIEGITQTQVDHEKGYDFLSGLRASLRQDPDVVMVGEIRDKETASVAVNAALTGHLVLSTLHTNNAAGAIPRLLDLGINPGILTAGLSVSIAQRLVRKLCEHCKAKRAATPSETEVLEKILKQGREHNKDLGEYNEKSPDTFTVWEPRGCVKCGEIGYKGRIGVFEAILNDVHIQKILEHNPSEREVKIAGAKQGILSMKEDGVLKVLSGVTSLAEVEKVVDLEEDLHLFDQEIETETEEVPVTNKAQAEHPLQKTEPSSAPNEVAMLVDYLKLLEQEQERNPEIGLATKIKQVRETIIDVLKKGDIELLMQNPMNEKEQVHREVDLLVKDLQELEHQQTVAPDVGIAKKLKNIRETIENL